MKHTGTGKLTGLLILGLALVFPFTVYGKKKAETEDPPPPDDKKWSKSLEFGVSADEGSWNQLWPVEWKTVFGLECEYQKFLRLKSALKASNDPLQADGIPKVTLDELTLKVQVLEGWVWETGYDKTPAAEGLDLGLGGRAGLVMRKIKDEGYALDRFFVSTGVLAGTKNDGVHLGIGEYFDYGQYAPLTLGTLSWTWAKNSRIMALAAYYPTVMMPQMDKVIVNRGLGGAGLEVDFGCGALSIEGYLYGSAPSDTVLESFMDGGLQGTLRWNILSDPLTLSAFAKTGLAKLNQETNPRFELLAGTFLKVKDLGDLTLEGGLRTAKEEVKGLIGIEMKVQF